MDFHIFPLNNVFVVLTQTGKGSYYGHRLEGLGKYVLSDLQERGIDLDDVNFFLSADLLSQYQLCSKCSGKGRIEAHGSVEGVYVASVFDKIDLSKTGTKTCPLCRGMGVNIPNFF